MKTKKRPKMTEIDEVMSNFDGKIDREIERALKKNPEKVFARYPARNFNAKVWFTGKQFKAEVWCYHVNCGTYMELTLEELSTKICDKYGYV